MLRLTGFVYFFAFASAYVELPALLGDDGLDPAGHHLQWFVRAHGAVGAFVRAPSLFFLVGTSDRAMHVITGLGALAALAVTLGVTNAIVQVALWLLYMSIVHVGQVFYGYGWESLLLEVGFLTIFLAPVRSLHPLPAARPPTVVIWLFRWLIVRVMLGAGLVKLRGDACWTELSCLDYHFETQPVPSPVSFWFHRLPPTVHHLGVLYNHIVELGAPLVTFAPARLRHVAGVLFVSFQLTLIASGNLAFFNWITIVPALACFDDRFFHRLVPRRWRDRPLAEPSRAHERTARAVALVVGVLSIMPIANLLSPNQAMNETYEPLGLVSSYGAFGSVNRVREEVVLEGTNDEPADPQARWLAYELPCKPGDVERRPCILGPWHHRLDWQLWFAGMEDYDEEPWIVNLVDKLLHGDRKVLALFANDPFPSAPPRYVRILRYRYTMAPSGARAWWTREIEDEYLRPVALGDPDLEAFLRSRGFRD